MRNKELDQYLSTPTKQAGAMKVKKCSKARSRQQTSEEYRILCRPGSVKFFRDYLINSKLILTARSRVGNMNIFYSFFVT